MPEGDAELDDDGMPDELEQSGWETVGEEDEDEAD